MDQSVSVRVNPWPQVSLRRNITWMEDAAGFRHGCDRGVDGDVYSARVTVFGIQSEMNAFADWVETNGRGIFEVSEINGVAFAPIVDQSVPLNATILDLERLQRAFFSPNATGVDEVTFTLRAIQPGLVTSPSASLDSLRLLDQFEQDKSTTVVKSFYQNGGTAAADYRADAGRFAGRFHQTTDETRSILRYLMGTGTIPTGRALTFPFPSLPGVIYPFGKARGGLPLNCKAADVKVTRTSLDRWNLDLELVEAP